MLIAKTVMEYILSSVEMTERLTPILVGPTVTEPLLFPLVLVRVNVNVPPPLIKFAESMESLTETSAMLIAIELLLPIKELVLKIVLNAITKSLILFVLKADCGIEINAL